MSRDGGAEAKEAGAEPFEVIVVGAGHAGVEAALAAAMAVRSRGFMSGSGQPDLVAPVNSLINFEKTFPRLASWRPLRCMMFLNFE